MISKVAVNGKNDTIEENGLFPTCYVFGVTPRFPIITTYIPTWKERKEILVVARVEMNSIAAERKMMTVWTKNVPPAPDRV